MDILLSKKSKKFIELQDSITKSRINRALNKLPEGDVKKLKGEGDLFRLRIGNIRIIFSFQDTYIYIKNIDYRGSAY